jgi:hypothetical protein
MTQEELINKAIEWMKKEVFTVYSNTTIVEEKIKDFKKYMEDK